MIQNKIFDESYVGSQETILTDEKKSKTKEFLKNPVTQDDIHKYGSSKPKRIIIRAVIQHAKS